MNFRDLVLTDTNSIDKRNQREKLEKEIEAYLKRGKKIKRIPEGVGEFETNQPSIIKRRLWMED